MPVHRADTHIHFFHFGINLTDIPHFVRKRPAEHPWRQGS